MCLCVAMVNLGNSYKGGIKIPGFRARVAIMFGKQGDRSLAVLFVQVVNYNLFFLEGDFEIGNN